MSDANGRTAALTGNPVVMEFLRFMLWMVMFLWLSSAINARIAKNEQADTNRQRHIKRIEVELKLPPLPEQEGQ